jgi:sigma-B regulation protein RsbQ
VDVAARHNVKVSGPVDGPPMVFAHGFGCDQTMWRHVAHAFDDRFRVITFDHAGSGGSDPAYWDAARYSTLDGYAADVAELLAAMDLRDVVFVGHSVASMIGALAQVQAPDRFSRLVMVGPSPRYLDDEGYRGGFSRADIDELLESMAGNYLGWSAAMAPVIVGNPDRPQLGQELTEAFCRTDPAKAAVFARTTFLSDARDVLPRVSVPTLVLQCSDDVIAPDEVGRYVAATVPDAEFVQMAAVGHCPNLSHPEETIEAIRSYLRPLAA